MSKNKPSLLIPKHQNKTSKEIADMYLSHSAKLPTESSPEKPLKPEVKSSKSTISNPFINQETQETTSLEILQQILNHHSKTYEVQTNYFKREERLLEELLSTRFTNKINPAKVNQQEIFQSFKDEALAVDKKISELSAENKLLKEKLALATLEEVDERIRRETQSDRFIESYSNKLPEQDPDPPISVLLKIISPYVQGNNEPGLIQELEGFVGGIKENNIESYIIHLCQGLSSDRKRSKKYESESRRILRLKQEVANRLSESLLTLSKSNK